MRYCLYVLEGRVEKIDILYQRYELSPDDPRVRVPVGGKLMPAEEARGFEKEEGDLKATGYLGQHRTTRGYRLCTSSACQLSVIITVSTC